MSNYYAKSETSSAVEISTAFNSVSVDLSEYYTKSETSSNVEISTALDGKQPTGDYALTSDVPTKTSELTNDSGYITSAQVMPATNQLVYPSYAQNAVASQQINAFETSSGIVTDSATFAAFVTYNQSTNTYDLILQGNVTVPNNWIIYSLFGEAFSPSLTLTWCKGTIYRKRVTAGTVRWSKTYDGWMWLLNGRYAITASADGVEDGKLYVLFYEDETHQNCINDPATDLHTLTFSTYGVFKQIATVDGEAEQGSGDRNTTAHNATAFSGNLAYEYQLSAKADLSVLNEKADLSVVEAIESALSDYALTSQIPLSTSQLANNSGYLTEHQSLSDYYLKSETSSAVEIQTALDGKQPTGDYALVSQIPLSVSQLENDAGYLTEHQSLSDYYTKSETSSNVEISTALDLKQDKLTDEQMANVNTKCLPLNLSGNTAISGNNYLDFHCLSRFFAPVVMNGALDVKQLNIVNYEVDSYMSLSAMDEDTIGFVGGFNREHIAILNLKNDTIAYISDISAMYEARISALEARIAALENN